MTLAVSSVVFAVFRSLASGAIGWDCWRHPSLGLFFKVPVLRGIDSWQATSLSCLSWDSIGRLSAVQSHLRLLPTRKRVFGHQLPSWWILFRPRGFPPPRRLTPQSTIGYVATRDGHEVQYVSSSVFRTARSQATHRWLDGETIPASGFTPLKESPLSVAVPHHCGLYPLAVGPPSRRDPKNPATREWDESDRPKPALAINACRSRLHPPRWTQLGASTPRILFPCLPESTDTPKCAVQVHRSAHGPQATVRLPSRTRRFVSWTDDEHRVKKPAEADLRGPSLFAHPNRNSSNLDRNPRPTSAEANAAARHAIPPHRTRGSGHRPKSRPRHYRDRHRSIGDESIRTKIRPTGWSSSPRQATNLHVTSVDKRCRSTAIAHPPRRPERRCHLRRGPQFVAPPKQCCEEQVVTARIRRCVRPDADGKPPVRGLTARRSDQRVAWVGVPGPPSHRSEKTPLTCRSRWTNRALQRTSSELGIRRWDRCRSSEGGRCDRIPPKRESGHGM